VIKNNKKIIHIFRCNYTPCPEIKDQEYFVGVFVVKEPLDYQGRSFMHVPQDVGVNLRSAEPPAKCFLPKKLIHTWTGHNKGIHAIRWLPNSAHLLLSCSMDSKIKVCVSV